MAYGTGYPMNYQQQYMPQQIQPQYNQQGNCDIIWVQGEAGAKSFLVSPNSTVQLWDSENQFIYLKSTDAYGKPTIRTFEYKEVVNNTQDKLNRLSENENKSEYVTKAEFDEFSERVMKQLNYRRNYNNKYNDNNKGDSNNG